MWISVRLLRDRPLYLAFENVGQDTAFLGEPHLSLWTHFVVVKLNIEKSQTVFRYRLYSYLSFEMYSTQITR